MVTQIGSIPVTLGGLGLSAVDDAGVTWVNTDLKGWSSPGLRTQLQPREADHGVWWSPTYLDARPITITGMISAPTTAARDAAIEQLIAAVSLTDTLLTVADSVPKQALVRRSGELLVQLLGLYGATYSALVTAADPRRYSTVLQSQSTGLPAVTGGLTLPLTLPVTITATVGSGTITLVNQGSFPTRPTLTITGPCAGGFTIGASRPDGVGTLQTYSNDLGVGDVLVLDSDARTAILNGQVSRRRYLSGTWPEIPAHSSLAFSWTCPNYNANALLTGTCRSAWM